MKISNRECWRIVKYLLITFAVQYFLAQLSPSLTRAILFSGSPQTELWLTVLGYAYPLVIAAVCALVNRIFTFRSSKNWFIAVMQMVLATFLWNWLWNIATMMVIPQLSNAVAVILRVEQWKGLLWLAISYLLQRCVIYRGTLDTNNWYDHSHPTDEAFDEGVPPDE